MGRSGASLLLVALAFAGAAAAVEPADVQRGLPERQGRELVWFERQGTAPRSWLASSGDGMQASALLPEMSRDVVAARVSPDGRYVAYATEPQQREHRIWSIYDRRNNHMLEWRADDAAKGTSLAWRKDSGAVLYVRRGERDALVERGIRSTATARIAINSPAPRRLELEMPVGSGVLFVTGGDDERRRPLAWLLLEGRDWLVEPVASVEGAHVEPVHADAERVFLLTDHEAPGNRVVVARRGEGIESWRTLVPDPGAGSRIEQAVWVDGGVATRTQRPLQREVAWHPVTGEGSTIVELPFPGTVTELAVASPDELLLEYIAPGAPASTWRSRLRRK